jgi:steroid 5-alpha reductase family enzyme
MKTNHQLVNTLNQVIIYGSNLTVKTFVENNLRSENLRFFQVKTQWKAETETIALLGVFSVSVYHHYNYHFYSHFC